MSRRSGVPNRFAIHDLPHWRKLRRERDRVSWSMWLWAWIDAVVLMLVMTAMFVPSWLR